MMVISLIRNHMFGSHTLSESQQTALKEDMGQSQSVEDEGTNTKTGTPTTRSPFKKRLFAPLDLVVFSRFDIGVLISVTSHFVGIVNIGATKQMNISDSTSIRYTRLFTGTWIKVQCALLKKMVGL